MSKNNIIIGKSFEQYKKKYKNYSKHLYSFTKKEVEDFDKHVGTIGEKYVLKKHKWMLIGDTYYQIPKAPRLMWFKGLSGGAKLAICLVTLGVVGGAAGTTTYFLLNKSTDQEIIIEESVSGMAEILEIKNDTEGNKLIAFQGKDAFNEFSSVTIKINDYTLKDGTDYLFQASNDEKIKYLITIFKSTLEKHKGKIIITPVQPEPVKPFDGTVTETEWNDAIDYLFVINEQTSYKVEKTYTTEGMMPMPIGANFTLDVNSNNVKKSNSGEVSAGGDFRKIYNNDIYAEIFVEDGSSEGYVSSIVDIGSSDFYESIGQIKTYLQDKYSEYESYFDATNKVYKKEIESNSNLRPKITVEIKFNDNRLIEKFTIVETTEGIGSSTATFNFSKYGDNSFDFPTIINECNIDKVSSENKFESDSFDFSTCSKAFYVVDLTKAQDFDDDKSRKVSLNNMSKITISTDEDYCTGSDDEIERGVFTFTSDDLDLANKNNVYILAEVSSENTISNDDILTFEYNIEE